MDISPVHFVVVVVRLNPQEGAVQVVGFTSTGRGGLQKMAGHGGEFQLDS